MGLAWVAAATGAVLVLLGALPALQLRHPIAAMATAFVPYGVLAWLVVTLVVLTSRSWRVRAVALLTIPLLALQVAWTRPYWPREAATAGPPSGATLTVMTLSTYYGRADAAQLAAEAARARPDVVVLTEVTEDGMAALRATAWGEMFPNRVGEAGPAWTSEDTMVYSPWPLELLEAPATSDDTYVVRVEAPAGPVTVFAVHVANPQTGFAEWAPDLAVVRQVSERHLGESLVVVGDFNATREHAPLGDLLAVGLADAAEQAGRGWLPTFPAQRLYGPWAGIHYPSVIGLDHVLVGPGVEATEVRAFRVDGTDHRGLAARLTLRDASGAP